MPTLCVCYCYQVEGGGDEEIAEVVDEEALRLATSALGTPSVETLRFPLLCKNIKVCVMHRRLFVAQPYHHHHSTTLTHTHLAPPSL